jgi:RNA polymerase sigma-70 factor (ECF subfamily)
MTNAESRVSTGEGRGLPADEPSDYLLLSRFRGGCQEAARDIYRRYAKRLRALAEHRCASGLANHVDADDIVQAVFGAFFHGASRGRYDIPDGEDLWKLFLVIALNKIRAEGAFQRAAKRDVRRTAALDHVPTPAGETFETSPGFLRLVVEEALERLPERHRDVVQKRLEGHGVAEIAQLLGRSKRSVERILQESRDRLSVILRD